MENIKVSRTKQNILDGIQILNDHPIFKYMNRHCNCSYHVKYLKKDKIGNNIKSYINVTNRSGEEFLYYPNFDIYFNENIDLSPKTWAYILAHNILHLVFGHFDFNKIPLRVKAAAKSSGNTTYEVSLWNKACDIYVTKFLSDIKFGESLVQFNENDIKANLRDEESIYEYLLNTKSDYKQTYGVADPEHLDMIGIDNPIEWPNNNWFEGIFIDAVAYATNKVIEDVNVSSYSRKENLFDTSYPWGRAASWFLNSYPLLGGIASSFKIVADKNAANKYDIHIAAIDVDNGEIIINSECDFTYETWKFILAHEYLHAGLSHAERCQGRNPKLWNIACDFVINGWLNEMNIGSMPTVGLYYDPKLKGRSAEDIYDEIIRNAKEYEQSGGLGVRGKGDIIRNGENTFDRNNNAVSLDEFCKSALIEGLEYHKSKGRGFLPKGLEEEIRALAMPVISWDVELAKWFDEHFTSKAKHRSYARPSRRQASTPNIPRPRTIPLDYDNDNRTFGVIIDTSGSMTSENLGKALGSIASFANAKEVEKVRVVFCDAKAYDSGYLSTEDIAGRVKMIGRGGTKLQPAVDLLEEAKDFPKDGPILLITDGFIEERMNIKREHAFLIPRGNHLPFNPKGKVFYFK